MRINNLSSLDYTSLLGNNNNSSSSLLFETLIDNLSNNTQNINNTSCCNHSSSLDSLDNLLNIGNVDLNIGKVSVDTSKNTVSMTDLDINYLGRNIKIDNLVINHLESNNTSNKTDSNTSLEEDNETITTTNQTVTTENVSSNTNREIDSKINNAINLAKKQLGKDYVWGANGPDTFDCSGFTKYIYKETFGIDIPRVSYDQAKFGKEVSKNELQPGDLVFFDTMNKGRVSHVGIYIGNNEFIHAANSKQGVITSSLSGKYEDKYITARRPYEK